MASYADQIKARDDARRQRVSANIAKRQGYVTRTPIKSNADVTNTTTNIDFDTSSFDSPKMGTTSTEPSWLTPTKSPKPIEFGDTLKTSIEKTSSTPYFDDSPSPSYDAPSAKTTTTTPTASGATQTQTASFGPVGSSSGVSGAPSALGGQYNQDGTFNPDYVPSSEAEAFQSGVDAYTRQKWLANLYKSQGIEFDPDNLPKSFDEEAKDFLKSQKEDQSILDQQIQYAKDKQLKRASQTKQAVLTDLTSGGREGVQSLSNVQAAKDISGAISADTGMAMMDLNLQRARLEDMQKEQQRNYIAGREDQIRAQMAAVAQAEAAIMEQQAQQVDQTMKVVNLLQDSGALANLDEASMAFLEQGLPGVPPGVMEALGIAATEKRAVEQNQQLFDNQVKALGSMKELAMNGISMTPEMMMSYSQQTGLPLESVMQFNQMASQVMNDKSLDSQQKMLTVSDMARELDLKQRGLLTEKTQQAAMIMDMVKSGQISASEAGEIMQMSGIEGSLNPMTQLNMRIDQAELAAKEIGLQYLDAEKRIGIEQGMRNLTMADYDLMIKSAEAAGAPALEIAKLKKAQADAEIAHLEAFETGQKFDEFLPNDVAKSIFTLSGPTRVTESSFAGINGRKQCGEAFNDFTEGPKVGSSYASKMKHVTNRDNPQVGNGLVLPLAGTNGKVTYGHIETVIGINLATNQIQTVSYNRDLKGGQTFETYDIDDLKAKYGDNWGFIPSKFKSKYADQLAQVGGSSLMDKVANQFIGQGVDKKAAQEQAKKLILEGKVNQETGEITENIKPATEAEKSAALYYNRMQESEDIFSSLEDQVSSMSWAEMQYQRSAPNVLKSPVMQQQEQAERNFINAVLRRESGAAIADSEFESARQQYFPQPGDSPEVLAQKKKNRNTAVQGLKTAAGSALNGNTEDAADSAFSGLFNFFIGSQNQPASYTDYYNNIESSYANY